MRDIALLTSTLETIRDDGRGTAHLKGCDRGGGWHAGGTLLNQQAIRDLIDDGWLRPASDQRSVRLDAWPSFATQDIGHA